MSTERNDSRAEAAGALPPEAAGAPSWLHRHTPYLEAATPHGWTSHGGPDFKHPVDSPAMETVVDTLARGAGLEGGAWAEQVHGGTVLRVDSPGPAGAADALWTTTGGLGVVGRSADCPLILVAGKGPDGMPLAGFAHASWRSTVRSITTRLLDEMKIGGLDVATARAVVCPSAGPCCYEVGAEVHREACERLGPAAARHFRSRGDRFILDLWSANQQQLEAAGMAAHRIWVSGECTICGEGHPVRRYPSYRRQGQAAGRFAAIQGVGSGGRC